MKITNNSSANYLAKLGLGVPSGSAKPQLGLWMGCSLLVITLLTVMLNRSVVARMEPLGERKSGRTWHPPYFAALHPGYGLYSSVTSSINFQHQLSGHMTFFDQRVSLGSLS